MDNNQQATNTILDASEPVLPSAGAAPAPNTQNPEEQKAQGQIIKKKSKTGLIIGIIILVLVLAGGAVAAVFIIGNMKRTNWHTDIAKSLIETISSGKSEKSVFFAQDLEKLNEDMTKSPYGDYSRDSYVTNYDGKTYACLNDDNYKVSGTADNLVVEKLTEDNACKYKFNDDEKEAYLYNYITRKYGLIVDKDKTKKQKEEYVITTDKGVIYATISLVGTEVKVTDDHETLSTDYSDYDNLADLIEDFGLKYLGVAKFSENTDIIGISASKNEAGRNIIIIQSVFTQTDATSFLEKLQEYVKGKPVDNAVIGVARYRTSGSIGSNDFNVTTDYLVGLYVIDGDYSIKTVLTTEYAEIND